MSNWAIIPSDSDVIHRYHKYIEKVRTTKGGWRYIYKRSNKKNYNKSSGLKEKQRLKDAEKNTDEARSKYQEVLRQNEQARKQRVATGTEQDKNVSMNRLKDARKSLEAAERSERNSFESYLSTPIGKTEAFIKGGAQIISDFIKTFPQMASTKMSYLMNGSPYNTKGAIDKVSDQILKAANDLSKLPTPRVKTDSGALSELNRSVKDINKEINNDINKLLKSNDKTDPLDWYKRKKRG